MLDPYPAHRGILLTYPPPHLPSPLSPSPVLFSHASPRFPHRGDFGISPSPSRSTNSFQPHECRQRHPASHVALPGRPLPPLAHKLSWLRRLRQSRQKEEPLQRERKAAASRRAARWQLGEVSARRFGPGRRMRHSASRDVAGMGCSRREIGLLLCTVLMITANLFLLACLSGQAIRTGAYSSLLACIGATTSPVPKMGRLPCWASQTQIQAQIQAPDPGRR